MVIHDRDTIYNALVNEPLKWQVFAWSGLSPSEILSLKWDDTDIDGRSMTVRSEKHGIFIEPMSDKLASLLAELKEDGIKNKYVMGGMKIDDARAWCRGFAERNGIKELSIYSFRVIRVLDSYI